MAAESDSLPTRNESTKRPILRVFEDYRGRQCELQLCGLRPNSVCLRNGSGTTRWIPFELLSVTDQQWIETRRTRIETYLSSTASQVGGTLESLNSQYVHVQAEQKISTEALRDALAEEWEGEVRRGDNLFAELARSVGWSTTNRSVAQWYSELRQGLSYSAADQLVNWNVPVATDWRSSSEDKVREKFVSFVIGTLSQKIGMSDVNWLEDRVVVSFVPVFDTPNPIQKAQPTSAYSAPAACDDVTPMQGSPLRRLFHRR